MKMTNRIPKKKERCDMAIVAEEKRCIGCAICVLICPQDAMRMPSSFIVHIDKDKCNKCGDCLACCPVDALKEV
jgi:NAD-dependent dihydropyrimidine dehydrogenase PreA subunit